MLAWLWSHQFIKDLYLDRAAVPRPVRGILTKILIKQLWKLRWVVDGCYFTFNFIMQVTI
jgi:hypothetical protein